MKAGSYAANTQMAVIEGAIAGQPGIGVEVTTYAKADTYVAECYSYKVSVIITNKSVTFESDDQRQWSQRW